MNDYDEIGGMKQTTKERSVRCEQGASGRDTVTAE